MTDTIVQELRAENAHLKTQLQREIHARMARHAAKRTLTKIQRACKRLAAPLPPKRDDAGVITAAWRSDRSSRKAARRQLRRVGAVVR